MIRASGKTFARRLRLIRTGVRVRDIALSAALTACMAIASGPTTKAASVDAVTSAITAGADDQSPIEAARGPDGRLRGTVRGRFFGGRRFIKAIFGNPSASDMSGFAPDADLDIKVAVLMGFNGEALREVELRLSTQGGEIRDFALAAKLGGDAELAGDLRTDRDGARAIALATNEAGALLRFADFYPRMAGGQMSMVLNLATQDGHLRAFSARIESGGFPTACQ
ncbi:MAG: hypothetical protein ACLPKB_17370 [Xanthobacteraceae bacterium]